MMEIEQINSILSDSNNDMKKLKARIRLEKILAKKKYL